jgi:hypothetical protein
MPDFESDNVHSNKGHSDKVRGCHLIHLNPFFIHRLFSNQSAITKNGRPVWFTEEDLNRGKPSNRRKSGIIIITLSALVCTYTELNALKRKPILVWRRVLKLIKTFGPCISRLRSENVQGVPSRRHNLHGVGPIFFACRDCSKADVNGLELCTENRQWKRNGLVPPSSDASAPINSKRRPHNDVSLWAIALRPFFFKKKLKVSFLLKGSIKIKNLSIRHENPSARDSILCARDWRGAFTQGLFTRKTHFVSCYILDDFFTNSSGHSGGSRELLIYPQSSSSVGKKNDNGSSNEVRRVLLMMLDCYTSGSGMPDGLFSNQKSQFGKILEGLAR